MANGGGGRVEGRRIERPDQKPARSARVKFDDSRAVVRARRVAVEQFLLLELVACELQQAVCGGEERR